MFKQPKRLAKTELNMRHAPSNMMKRSLRMLTNSHVQWSLTPTCIMEMHLFRDFDHFMKTSAIDCKRFWARKMGLSQISMMMSC